ncbi:unnamed protein product, partial [Rotaria sordida]
MENKESFGVDRTAKVGVAGDSAGAMISTSVCQTVKDIDFQILVYGWYDFTCATPSFKEFTNQQYFVTPELVDWCIKNAFNDGFDINDSRISVFRNTSLEKLPPTLLIVAELDPVRDDSYTYKELLDKAGVKNKLVLIKGVLHRFFPLPGNEQTYGNLTLAPYGALVGIASTNVSAYSNENDTIISNESNYLYGCVFDRVDAANDMWSQLSFVQQVVDGKCFSLKKYQNGSKSPPKNESLLIYSLGKDMPFGHVSVIVDVLNDSIRVAEQNFHAYYWSSNYSRQIPYIMKNENQQTYGNSTLAPYGALVGIASTNVSAYSNGNDTIISNESNCLYVKDMYMRWQCVEYARRWLFIRKGCVFDSVDAANDMWSQLSFVQRVVDGKCFSLKKYQNGSKSPPKNESLLIYSLGEDMPFGHVSVIVDVLNDSIRVAEQNFHAY